MIKHHPNTNILAEYAAGTLGFAQSIAVSAHLHFCSHCRQQVQALESLGGALLLDETAKENSESHAIPEDLFDRVMKTIDESQPSLNTAAPQTQRNTKLDSLADLPPVVANLIGSTSKLAWKHLSKSLQIAPVVTGQHDCEVSLHKISAGGKVLAHDHRGMEYTLVLKGSFSDENGVYQVGDFIVKQPGEQHKPAAAENRDCLCLTVVEAPVRFTGLFSRLLNPFLRVQPQ